MPSVLLVENDRPVLSVLRTALYAAGFETLTAATLDEVETRLRGKPDVLVMNIDMPRQIKEPFFEYWFREAPGLKIADLIDKDEEGPSHLADLYFELPFHIEAFALRLYGLLTPDHEAPESANPAVDQTAAGS
jgi:DNA-binding response OmpR family regulator